MVEQLFPFCGLPAFQVINGSGAIVLDHKSFMFEEQSEETT